MHDAVATLLRRHVAGYANCCLRVRDQPLLLKQWDRERSCLGSIRYGRNLAQIGVVGCLPQHEILDVSAGDLRTAAQWESVHTLIDSDRVTVRSLLRVYRRVSSARPAYAR